MAPTAASPDVVLREGTPADAAAVTEWRYEGRWSIYDGRAGEHISTEAGYRAIADRKTGRFLGYVCVGVEARVQGMVAEPDVIDVGVGLDPSIVGQGRGRAIVEPAIDWIERKRRPVELRAVVQSWNERSVRFCLHLGFEPAGLHTATQTGNGVEYLVLRRRAALAASPRHDGPGTHGTQSTHGSHGTHRLSPVSAADGP